MNYRTQAGSACLWLSIYPTPHGQLFQQNSSTALQASPWICTARPTIPTPKSWNTVFPSPSTQIHIRKRKKNNKNPKLFCTLARDSENHQEVTLCLVGVEKKKKKRCLLPAEIWPPHSQVRFSSVSCDAEARDAGETHFWESQLGNSLSADPC